MRYLSPTLLDSFGYYLRLESGAASDQARQGLIDRLRGVKTPPSEAMQRGIDFENDVCACCDWNYQPKEERYDACVAEIAQHVRGAKRQVHVSFELMDGIGIHGYVDFLQLFAEEIIDVKTTKKYSLGKYLRNNQHLAYLTALQRNGFKRFAYLVMDFEHMTTTREEYYWKPDMLIELRSRAMHFLGYLENDPEMKQAFENHKPHKKIEEEI